MVLVLLAFLFPAIAFSNCLYEPPFKKGSSYRIIQAFNGKYSHRPPLEYGVDFEMPKGELIYSAREGKVVELKMMSNIGGPSKKFLTFGNKIILSHEGGEFTLYAHLKKGSHRVKVGQQIPAGFPLARSGCTGWCDGPHLHFEVFTKKESAPRVSKKFKFKTRSGCTVPKFGTQISN